MRKPSKESTMAAETQTAAEMIAEELRSICTEDALEALRDPRDTNTEDLSQHMSLVRTRLGGDFEVAAWDDALEILRGE